MAEPLAESSDVAERLGRALTTEESTKIDALLDDASASVRAYTGQTFTLEETTQLLPIRNRAIKLPLRPVTEIGSVVDANGNDLSYTWIDGDVSIELASSGWINEWELNVTGGSRPAKANVTYTHGYESVPQDIIGVVCQIAGRALGTSSTDAGLTGETIAGYSYQQGAAAGSGPWGMLPDEKSVLDRYRVPVGPAAMI